MKRIAVFLFLIPVMLFSDLNMLSNFLDCPSLVPKEDIIIVKGKVMRIEGFPNSSFLEKFSGLPCYEVFIADDDFIEKRLLIKFARHPYFQYWIFQESTLSLEEWYSIEKSFVPVIGENYEFSCINVIDKEPIIDLYPLYSLYRKENVSGLLVIYKRKTS